MIVLGVLVIMTLTTLSNSMPLSYETYRTRGLNDDNDAPYLIDGPSVNDIYWPPIPLEATVKVMNNSLLGIDRVKKLRSLSVTNSFDVLRQRVLLELARRKAQQDQKQIDANRRILENIGKRSKLQSNTIFPHRLEMKNGRLFDNQRERKTISQNPPYKNLDWYNNYGQFANSNDDDNDDNQYNEMDTNEIHLL